MPGMAVDGDRAPAVRARHDRLDRHVGGGVDAGRRRRLHRQPTSSLGALPFVWPITEDIKVPVHYPLTTDKIRFAGDAVAVVVAETREQAEDAAEAVIGRGHRAPGGHRPREAAKDEVVIHDDLGTNVVVHWSHGGARRPGDLRRRRR